MSAPSKIAIFSDLHLSSHGDEKRILLFAETLKNLRLQEKITELWLLGDIFDLLIGPYNFWTQIYKNIFQELQALSKCSCKILWVEGNHDFFIEDIVRSVGAKAVDEVLEMNVLASKVHMAHGDLAHKKDKFYLLWRAFTRSKILRSFLKLAPEAFAEKILLPLGEAMSAHSRSRHGYGDDPSLRELYRNYARKQFESGSRGVILGHCHISDFFKEGDHFYLNLGSWLSPHKTYALWSPESQKFPEIISAE